MGPVVRQEVTLENQTDNFDAYREAKSLLQEGKTEQAVALYEKIFETGGVAAAESAYSLGVLYDSGYPSSQTPAARGALAEKYYQASEALGYSMAAYRRGALYQRQGRLVDALRLFEATSHENPSSAYWAARILYANPALANDRDSGHYFERAADLGHLLAIKHIALEHLKGRRGPLGVAKGLALYAKLLPAVRKAVREGDKLRFT